MACKRTNRFSPAFTTTQVPEKVDVYTDLGMLILTRVIGLVYSTPSPSSPNSDGPRSTRQNIPICNPPKRMIIDGVFTHDDMKMASSLHLPMSVSLYYFLPTACRAHGAY